MLPTLRLQSLDRPGTSPQDDSLCARNAADGRHGNAGDTGGNALTGRCREKQLVVLATVERERQIDAFPLASDACTGNIVCHNLGPHARLLADMAEISRQSVTQIDHASRNFARAQKLAHGKTRHGMKVARKILGMWFPAGKEILERGGAPAQLARDINAVPRPGA